MERRDRNADEEEAERVLKQYLGIGERRKKLKALREEEEELRREGV